MEVFVIVLPGEFSVEGDGLLLISQSNRAYLDRVHTMANEHFVLPLGINMPFIPLEEEGRGLDSYLGFSFLVDRMIELDCIVIFGVLPSLELRLEEERITHRSIQYIKLRYPIERVLNTGYLDKRTKFGVFLIIFEIDPT